MTYTDQLEALDQKIRDLEEQLALSKQNTSLWFKRYKELHRQLNPSAVVVMLQLGPKTMEGLAREATIRGDKPEGFARRIIEIVVRDQLFAAVLDN